MKIAIIGAGWSGLAAAVQAVQSRHQVTVFEAARHLGGRARTVPGHLPDGREVALDNGQHILIGAYQETLRLMQCVGVDVEQSLVRLPLRLRYPDGNGLQLPNWPAPWDALAGIVCAQGWNWRAKCSLLRQATSWQASGFSCGAEQSVSQLCRALHPVVFRELIEPLCVSALNTPADSASAQVFLKVLRDSLFGPAGSSNLLLPRVDLSALFPDAAAHWLRLHAAQVQSATRVQSLGHDGRYWQVQGEAFDRVIVALGASEAVHVLSQSTAQLPSGLAAALALWCATASNLRYEAIATVYAFAPNARLPGPLLALRSDASCPAQFAFDRGQLGGPAGLIALVISAAHGERETLQHQALAQAQSQLGLNLAPVQTITEKRATFACTTHLQRPPLKIAPGLLACGDYVLGPYPATLEATVRNAMEAVASLSRSP